MKHAYPPQTVGFLGPGIYRGYVAVSGGRNHSAAAWSCQPEGSEQHEILYGEGVSAGKSTANRASARGALRVLELAAPNSTIKVVCDLDLTVNALNQDLIKWAGNGWQASNGPLQNADIWMQIHELIKGKRLTVTAAKPALNSEDAKIVTELKAKAKTLRARQDGLL